MRRGKVWQAGILVSLCLQAALTPAQDRAGEGRWIKRGQPLTGNEFPACYQLWVCIPRDAPPQETGRQAKQRPQGSWGYCEHFMQGEEAGCGECLAPEPDEPCQPGKRSPDGA